MMQSTPRAYINDNYVLKPEYDAKIAALESRIAVLEST